jgi:hypothetical protein
MTISAQRPSTSLIHHSDGGVQHASHDYRAALAAHDITASMSRRGDCTDDNAPIESFFHTLKAERVHHRQYATRAEAQRDIFAYIEDFASFGDRLCQPDRDGAKSSLTLSTFWGKTDRPLNRSFTGHRDCSRKRCRDLENETSRRCPAPAVKPSEISKEAGNIPSRVTGRGSCVPAENYPWR